MRIVPQNEFFKSYKLPPSRVQWATRRARSAAVDVGAPRPIVDTFDELEQECVDYTAARRAWEAARNATVDPLVAESDHKVDRSFSNFVQRAEMELEDHGRESTRGMAAKNLLDGPLNVEVYSVTNATREEEEAMLRSIIDELDSEHIADIQACGLDASFRVLKDDFATFTAAMSATSDGEAAPTTEQLREMEDVIESKMIEAIHRVNGAYPSTSQADRERRSKILGPFAIQNDRAAAYFKRNRGANRIPDLDPDADDEFVDGDDVQSGGAEPVSPDADDAKSAKN